MQLPTRLSALLLTLPLAYAVDVTGAEDIEPLPDDFLEYLASFEADRDDWTYFATQSDKKSAKKRSENHRDDPPAHHPPAATKDKKP